MRGNEARTLMICRILVLAIRQQICRPWLVKVPMVGPGNVTIATTKCDQSVMTMDVIDGVIGGLGEISPFDPWRRRSAVFSPEINPLRSPCGVLRQSPGPGVTLV